MVEMTWEQVRGVLSVAIWMMLRRWGWRRRVGVVWDGGDGGNRFSVLDLLVQFNGHGIGDLAGTASEWFLLSFSDERKVQYSLGQSLIEQIGSGM